VHRRGTACYGSRKGNSSHVTNHSHRTMLGLPPWRPRHRTFRTGATVTWFAFPIQLLLPCDGDILKHSQQGEASYQDISSRYHCLSHGTYLSRSDIPATVLHNTEGRLQPCCLPWTCCGSRIPVPITPVPSRHIRSRRRGRRIRACMLGERV
jgi:hypothetical protein